MSPPVPSQVVGGGTTTSIRPGSMADRARQAKIPQPEPGLKCPRCQSTNTKFCYFNNYSLTQPRHFCKMCRRYWTKGGALRNVPVGGGFRKSNKRSSNKGGGAARAVEDHQASRTDPNHNSTSPISSNSNKRDHTNNNFNHGNMLVDNSNSLDAGRSFQLPPMTQFPLLASIQGLNHNHIHGQYESPTISNNNLGLNFCGMMSASTAQGELGFHIGSSASSVNTDHHQQWKPNHFHNNFLAAFDPLQFAHRPLSTSSQASSLYHFPIDQYRQSLNQLQEANNQHLVSTSSIMPLKNSSDQKDNEADAVKAEEAAAASHGGMGSLSRSFLGMSDWNNANNNNNSSTTWTSTDLSGINNTSSTTHRLL